MANKIKPDSQEALLAQLKNPFETRLVKWRTGGGSKQLAYVDARDVMKRLDDIMGVGNWQDRYIAVDGGFLCELSLRLDGEWITKSNGANNTKVEAIKGGISSALKRAAVEWGIGRYLYYLDPNKFNAKNVAQWPKWALPNNDIDDWETIAEMEASLETGMDEVEATENIIESVDKIRAATTIEELSMIMEGMDAEVQLKFATEIQKKTKELLNKNAEPTV